MPSASRYESWEAVELDPEEEGAAGAIRDPSKPKRAWDFRTFKEYLQYLFQGVDSYVAPLLLSVHAWRCGCAWQAAFAGRRALL